METAAEWQRVRAEAEALLARLFDESQHPRDERGRFAEGGGDAAPASFVSPNVSNLSFEQAVAALKSPEQAKLNRAASFIDSRLGLRSTNYPAIGAWSDGAENSMMVVAPGASVAQMRAASAMKGFLADQKAVLVFTPSGQGDLQTVLAEEFLLSFEANGDVGDIHQRLLNDDVAFHTLVPLGGDRFRVHVYASDEATADAVDRAAEEFNSDVHAIPGQGEFIGTKLETGTDREQRDDARRVYEDTIKEIEATGALENLSGAWDDVRNYWNAGPSEEKVKRWRLLRARAEALLRAWDESKHPRVPAGSPDGGQFGEGGGGGDGEGAVALDPKVIEVGGDEWNRATARRLEREYQEAKPKVEKLAQESVGKTSTVAAVSEEVEPPEEEEEPPFEPEEWDMLSNSGQTEAEEQYISKNTDAYYDSEVENWQSEDGGGPRDAKIQVAEDFNDGKNNEWAEDALDEVRSGREGDAPPIPYTNEQLLAAIQIDDYDVDSYPKKDPSLSFDDEKLQEPSDAPPPPSKDQLILPGVEIQPPDRSKHLTDEMREEIESALLKAYEKEADRVLSAMEPPEYLKESAEEFAGESWSQMDDESKFDWVKNHTSIVEDESTPGSGEKSSKQIAGSLLETVEALPGKYDPLQTNNQKKEDSDYVRTQKLARWLSVARTREVLAERKIPALMDDAILAGADARLWRSWKDSSTSHNGALLQIATADELGGRLNAKTARELNRDEEIKRADSEFAAIGGYAGVKAYLRAKWEVTQFLLDKAGLKTVKAYRGVGFDEEFIQKSVHKHASAGVKVEGGYTYMPTMPVKRNGAASATVDAGVANGWGSDYNRVVLRAEVPRTAIVSIPAYGINVHGEREVVIAGTAWVGWDAWNGKAPSFDQVSLRHAA